MANMMKVCPGCREWTSITANTCSKCGKELINASLSEIFWNKISDEQKAQYTIQFCGETLTEEERANRDRHLEERQYELEHMILTTCPSVEGSQITKQLGLVFGEIVFKTGLIKSLGATIANIGDIYSFGDKELSGTTSLLDNARQYAIKKITKEAWDKGANAIVGINSESSILNDLIHITIMGTAVYVQKNQ